MPIGASIFLGVVLVGVAALDIVMLVTLSMPGDERNQIIVWKASAFTLLATVGGWCWMLLRIMCEVSR